MVPLGYRVSKRRAVSARRLAAALGGPKHHRISRRRPVAPHRVAQLAALPAVLPVAPQLTAPRMAEPQPFASGPGGTRG